MPFEPFTPDDATITEVITLLARGEHTLTEAANVFNTTPEAFSAFLCTHPEAAARINDLESGAFRLARFCASLQLSKAANLLFLLINALEHRLLNQVPNPRDKSANELLRRNAETSRKCIALLYRISQARPAPSSPDPHRTRPSSSDPHRPPPPSSPEPHRTRPSSSDPDRPPSPFTAMGVEVRMLSSPDPHRAAPSSSTDPLMVSRLSEPGIPDTTIPTEPNPVLVALPSEPDPLLVAPLSEPGNPNTAHSEPDPLLVSPLSEPCNSDPTHHNPDVFCNLSLIGLSQQSGRASQRPP